MSALPRTLPAVVAALQAGRAEEASEGLAAILEREPANGGAWTLAGFLRLQKGNPAEAVALLDRALECQPGQWLAHLHRASAREAIGNWIGAAADYASAAELHPQPEFRVRQAALLGKLGARAAEREALEAALRLDPASVPALNNLGLCHENLGDEAAALACFERAALAAVGKPENADVAENLERLLFEKGKRLAASDPVAAARFYQAEIARHPEYGGLQTGLGNFRLERGEIALAEEAFAAAVRLRPADAEARINHGIAFHRLGRLSEALACYAKAENLLGGPARATPELRWNRSLSLLIDGRLEEGFRDYEARDHYEGYRRFPFPRWEGQPFPDGKLLIHTEQGFGDAIQFVRYAALAKQRGLGGSVHVACDPTLRRLLARAGGVDAVVGADEAIAGAYTWQVPMLSLPHVFGTSLETIPASIPYLDLPAAPSTGSGPFRIALVWAGNPKYRNDLRRSCPLALFDALGELPGTEWSALQPGAAEAGARERSWLRDDSPQLTDFYETALRLLQADLVISVDTAVVHLAGALGRPVWVLLPFAPDWRWLRARYDSPWYPTARLFRQEREGDWTGVAARIASALRALLAERKAV